MSDTYSVIYSPEARSDIKEIYSYIAFTVTIIRIVYGGRDIQSMVSQTHNDYMQEGQLECCSFLHLKRCIRSTVVTINLLCSNIRKAPAISDKCFQNCYSVFPTYFLNEQGYLLMHPCRNVSEQKDPSSFFCLPQWQRL